MLGVFLILGHFLQFFQKNLQKMYQSAVLSTILQINSVAVRPQFYYNFYSKIIISRSVQK